MNTATLQAFSYFPSTVYRDEQPEWVGYTQMVFNRYFDNAPPQGVLNQTESMVNDPSLKFLTDYLLQSSVEILRTQGYAVDKYDFYLSGLWGQTADCMGGTNIHVHKNSQICGWFFLETPKGGSYPVFYDPRMNKQMIELDYLQRTELTDASPQVHFDNIKPGTILMANSWMQHQLIQNNSQTKTKCIHFIISHRDRQCSIY